MQCYRIAHGSKIKKKSINSYCPKSDTLRATSLKSKACTQHDQFRLSIYFSDGQAACSI